MRALILFLVLCTAFPTLGQSELYLSTLKQFQQHYNQADAQAVFDMFDEPMQQSVTLVTTHQIVSSFNNRWGRLLAFTYQKSEGQVEIYRGTFEKGEQEIRISVAPSGKLSGLLFKPIEADGSPGLLERTVTELQFPAEGTWLTVWGGDTKAQNYHIVHRAQRGAFDFLIVGDQNKTYKGHGTKNEDYYAFGQPLYAVCDATVVQVITGVNDNQPGVMNPAQVLGNSITLKTDNNEYIVYAHFQKGTVAVSEGQKVSKGTYLGNCGNSGNSSEPHLHLHVQDGPDVHTATGVKAYFGTIEVNGSLKKDYSPVRLDRVSRPDQ